MAAKPKFDERDGRKYWKALVAHTEYVSAFLALLDEEMKAPSSPERGKRIAALANKLDMANASARRFTLGIR